MANPPDGASTDPRQKLIELIEQKVWEALEQVVGNLEGAAENLNEATERLIDEQLRLERMRVKRD